MKSVKLQLSLDEANLVLEALGNLPFSKVYELIAKIQTQASQQLSVEELMNESDPVDIPAQQITV